MLCAANPDAIACFDVRGLKISCCNCPTEKQLKSPRNAPAIVTSRIHQGFEF
jgi:hypothetical protein